MTVTLWPLAVDAVEPGAVERFWAAALGGPQQRVLLSFRPQISAKTVKNRTLADVEENEFCAFLDPALDEGALARAFAVCTDSDRPEELPAWGGPPRSALTSAWA